MRKPGRIQDLNGMFIYHDDKGHTFFYDIITKQAFILSAQDLRYCLYYTSLLPFMVVVTLSLVSFMEINLLIAVTVGIGGYLLAEILFRLLYFYKLPKSTKFKPNKDGDSFLIRFAKKYSPQRLIVLAILMVLIATFTAIYVTLYNSLTYAIITGYILAVLCILVAIFSLIALGIRKKNRY